MTRIFDLIAAALLLLALSPLLLLIAIAVRVGSRGPALYRSRRVGRGGETFPLLKFRTMAPGAEELWPLLQAEAASKGELVKLESDPRITPVGRRLRRHYLDELPQLVNVLRGEMSLVGPRPLIPEEDRLVSGPDRERLDVRPGMTGPWQVLGSRRVSLAEMIRLDCQYVQRHSLATNLSLLARTVPCVVRGRGS